ncbi:phospho-N-acetylmuramoyl-pentapeptide-transferase [Victivallis sp. Marseille-Q1083]|uniref:phospho-N-acetylmuramoyl-pentapeptide- transferase n=1 Tax=Victivallis sp. Marseille-Q1083 TaxID=2717288 RepID=UPI00158AF70D|nr:phospho-N-acetylmuramoyl-pentapeptide-transferase [Victivallis sp. Marseille-Q1083]
MLYLLENVDLFGFSLRLFGYVTFRAGGAALTAMLFVMLFGPFTVRLLKRYRALAMDRYKDVLPEGFIDKRKNATPSMGGLLMLAGVALATVLWTELFNPTVLALLFCTVLMGLIGFADDYVKVTRNPKGISARAKFLAQCLVAAGTILFLYWQPFQPELAEQMNKLFVPFVKEPVLQSQWVLLLEMVVIVGASNAVNLTDGKDGLATGSVIFCALTYAVIAYVCGHRVFAEYLNVPGIPGASEGVVFAAAVIGACIGFLWHNCYPASMFMGDTGSLALGGAIGLLAVLVRQELLLVLTGGVFVMEALSVVIQVASFKLTGKRVFLCAPIHHHFERRGWTETQIVVRFWILAGIFALLSLASLKLR